MDELENRKDEQTKSWFFEKNNKIDKPLAKKRTQNNAIINEKGDFTSNIKEIQRIIK